MTDDGAAALAQALRQNVALKWLDVAQNKLTPACKDALEAYKRTYLPGINLTVFVDKDEAESERRHEEWKGKTLDNLQKGLELKIRLLGCDSLEVAKVYADIGMQLHEVIFLLRLLHLFLLILSECMSLHVFACLCMSLHVLDSGEERALRQGNRPLEEKSRDQDPGARPRSPTGSHQLHQRCKHLRRSRGP